MGLPKEVQLIIAYSFAVSISLVYAIQPTASPDPSPCAGTRPLGMSTSEIRDDQITASSVYSSPWRDNCDTRHSRLYMPNGKSWCPKDKSSSEWLQIFTGIPATVKVIAIQGRGDGKQWVKSYRISYSHDGYNWNYVEDAYGAKRTFTGNDDSYSVATSYLNQPITARYFRIHPVKWRKHPSLRLELYGCTACNELLGTPPYGTLRASGTWGGGKDGGSCQANDGALLSAKGWCAKNNRRQWLEIDIGPPTVVNTLITKGRGDSRRRNWVTSFKIAYRESERQPWIWYNGTLSPNRIKIFRANMDKHSSKFHYLSRPFTARYIRFYPTSWHNHIGMRVGVLGCPFRGKCHGNFAEIDPSIPCVENLAHNRPAWFKLHAMRKRHLRKRPRGDIDAMKPVEDGGGCIMIDNSVAPNPAWILDMGAKRPVSGVLVSTRNEKLQSESSTQNDDNAIDKPERPDGTIGRNETVALKKRTDLKAVNLYKLSVYVLGHPSIPDGRNSQKKRHMCRELTVVEGLDRRKLHFQCERQLNGRYVVISAFGSPYRSDPYYSAVLCNVAVYS